MVPSATETLLYWVIAVILFVMLAPLLTWTAYQAWTRHRRRQRVDAPRKILLVGDSDKEVGCTDHARSKSKAHRDEQGSLISQCRYCGAPMRRIRPREWELIDEPHATTAP